MSEDSFIQAAKDPTTAPVLLYKLGSISRLHRYVAQNPNTPPQRLILLAKWCPATVLKNPALPLFSVEEPLLWCDIVRTCHKTILLQLLHKMHEKSWYLLLLLGLGRIRPLLVSLYPAIHRVGLIQEDLSAILAEILRPAPFQPNQLYLEKAFDEYAAQFSLELTPLQVFAKQAIHSTVMVVTRCAGLPINTIPTFGMMADAHGDLLSQIQEQKTQAEEASWLWKTFGWKPRTPMPAALRTWVEERFDDDWKASWAIPLL